MPFLPLLLGLAPTVASWIMGDKTGAAVSKVTGIAQEILGTSDAAGIERAISTDPNLALQFRMAVIQAEADARRQAFDTLQAELADVASARSQTVELAKAGSAIAWGAVVVSVLVTTAFMAALWFVVRQEIPLASREIAYILLGTLGAKFGDIVAYWVGSSSGSAQKSAALEKAVVAGGRALMPADTDIGNMALSRLGTRATIADLTENSTEARQINLWYATVRDELQSLVDWNFNRVSQALAASGTPPARWASSYAYPSDCLRMRRLDFGDASWIAGEPAAGFEIASNGSGTFLYCNEDQVSAVYAQRVTDPARFTPGFILAFVDCLAASVAHAITQKADLAERLARRAQDRIERAIADSANEGMVPGDGARLARSLTIRGFDGSAS